MLTVLLTALAALYLLAVGGYVVAQMLAGYRERRAVSPRYEYPWFQHACDAAAPEEEPFPWVATVKEAREPLPEESGARPRSTPRGARSTPIP